MCLVCKKGLFNQFVAFSSLFWQCTCTFGNMENKINLNPFEFFPAPKRGEKSYRWDFYLI